MNIHLLRCNINYKASFQQVVANFSATWCGPCKIIAPYYCELSEKYTSMMFLLVDVDELTVSSEAIDIIIPIDYFAICSLNTLIELAFPLNMVIKLETNYYRLKFVDDHAICPGECYIGKHVLCQHILLNMVACMLQDFSTSWDIKATPTFFFLKDGQQLDKLVGANRPELEKKVVAIADSVPESKQ